MTIRYVRIRSGLPHAEAETFFLGAAAFEDWIAERLKPLRAKLRGDEVTGVNILSLDFRPPGVTGFLPRNTWGFLLNVAYHCQDLDVKMLVPSDVVENLTRLMPLAALACRLAPWPQVQAVEAALVRPLGDSERTALDAYIRRRLAYLEKTRPRDAQLKH